MNEPLNLETLEENAYQRNNLNDGMWDIIIGLCLILWSVALFTEYGALGGVWFACLFPMVAPIRKKLMRNRVGSAVPSVARQKKESSKRKAMIYTFGFTFLMGVAALALFAADSGTLGKLAEAMRGLGSSILAIPLILIAIATGIAYKIPRCFGYAFFILASFALVHFVDLNAGWSHTHFGILLSGIAPTATGFAMLGKFLKEHPVLDVPE